MVYKQLLRLEVIKERCLLSRRSMLGSQVVYYVASVVHLPFVWAQNLP